MGIAIVDIVFLGIIAIFTLRCAIRGAVSEVLSMAALVFGLLSAIFFYKKAAFIVRERFMPDIKALPEIISFVALFLIVFGVIKILESILKNIVEGIQLKGPDHFLGFILGFAEGLIVVCLLLFIIYIQPFVDSAYVLDRSFFAELLLPFIIGDKSNITDSVVMCLKRCQSLKPGGIGV
jgi:membrane protein required for colicin V production